MIGIIRESLAEVPVLRVEDTRKEGQPLPIITYIHGITSAKEQNLPLAYFLAERGYRVILPDCHLHGERAKGFSNQEVSYKIWEVVMQNLKELPMIYQALREKNLVKDNKFGLAGTSMGGITTSAALTQFEWIDVAAVVMGSPQPVRFAEEQVAMLKQMEVEVPLTEEEQQELMRSLETIDLSKQPNKLNGRPIFFWHGEEDQVVPFDHSYSFYNDAIAHYKNPENIRFLREVGRDHKVSLYAIQETAKWFELHL